MGSDLLGVDGGFGGLDGGRDRLCRAAAERSEKRARRRVVKWNSCERNNQRDGFQFSGGASGRAAERLSFRAQARARRIGRTAITSSR